MIDNLVIVESPAKAKTIEKFLGKDYHVVSSFGHIRDIEKKNVGIDIDHNFNPAYEIPKDKIKLVNELKKYAADSKDIWIASDEDREGEAIAWHLAEVLNLDINTTKRIVFHEITKSAITEAIKNPRTIDMNLVNSQQARRVLDRLVGFEISPVLWKKVQPALSAGRVQSVAVRLIVEREREIISFVPESSFRVVASFFVVDDKGVKTEIKAEASKRFATEEEATAFLNLCADSKFVVDSVSVKPGVRTPAPPFTTSTLQQEAYRKLGFSVSQTMSVAQKLYEAGKITYMRTDSTNLSSLAINTSKTVILNEYGDKYSKVRQFKTKSKGAQEAHEAIRPTYPETKAITGTANEKKLYDLIWKRTIASQMADAEIEKTTIVINMNNSPITFNATGEVIIFDGFLKLYSESNDQDSGDDEKNIVPKMEKGMALLYKNIVADQRYTTPPARYTEASLVKKLEELGIGRPSTYAPTISTIQNRGYVQREDRQGEKREVKILTLQKGKLTSSTKTEMAGKEKAKLFPQNIGMVVNDFLVNNFPKIVDYHFTAEVEEQFDDVAEGKMLWTNMLREFYTPFHETVENALEKRDSSIGVRVLGIDKKTGEEVVVKVGRFGPVAQIGSNEDGKKARYASLNKNQLIETITLDEALKLFDLPRNLGEYEGKEVVVGTGKFGPYVRHNNKFVSLKKGVDDPYTITLERAVELIKEKMDNDSKKMIHDFDDVKVLNGRFGPYITKDKINYKIPKDCDPVQLTKEACLEIIQKSDKTKK
ncbi:MAG: type I DNA topoisomerase [Bacteroidales bacterium]|nr:type I DNA topoisomerase [Bacteroidales bacterium]